MQTQEGSVNIKEIKQARLDAVQAFMDIMNNSIVGQGAMALIETAIVNFERKVATVNQGSQEEMAILFEDVCKALVSKTATTAYLHARKSLEVFSRFFFNQQDKPHFNRSTTIFDPNDIYKAIHHFYAQSNLQLEGLEYAQMYAKHFIAPADRQIKALMNINLQGFRDNILKKPDHLRSALSSFSGWQDSAVLCELFSLATLSEDIIQALASQVGNLTNENISSVTKFIARNDLSYYRKDSILSNLMKEQYVYSPALNDFYITALRGGQFDLLHLEQQGSVFYRTITSAPATCNLMKSLNKELTHKWLTFSLERGGATVATATMEGVESYILEQNNKQAVWPIMDSLLIRYNFKEVKDHKEVLKQLLAVGLQVGDSSEVQSILRSCRENNLFGKEELVEVVLDSFLSRLNLPGMDEKNHAIFSAVHAELVPKDVNLQTLSFIANNFECPSTHPKVISLLPTILKHVDINSYQANDLIPWILKPLHQEADTDVAQQKIGAIREILQAHDFLPLLVLEFNNSEDTSEQKNLYAKIIAIVRDTPAKATLPNLSNYNDHLLKSFHMQAKTTYGDKKLYEDFILAHPYETTQGKSNWLETIRKNIFNDTNLNLAFDRENHPVKQCLEQFRRCIAPDYGRLNNNLIEISQNLGAGIFYFKNKEGQFCIEDVFDLLKGHEKTERITSVVNRCEHLNKTVKKSFFIFKTSIPEVIQLGLQSSKVFIANTPDQCKEFIHQGPPPNPANAIVEKAQADMVTFQEVVNANKGKLIDVGIQLRCEKLLRQNISFLRTIKDHVNDLSMEDKFFLESNLGNYVVNCFTVYCKSLSRYELMLASESTAMALAKGLNSPEEFKEKIDKEALVQLDLIESEYNSVKDNILDHLGEGMLREMKVTTKYLQNKLGPADRAPAFKLN